MPVNVQIHEAQAVAYVTIENAPVNAIGLAERAGLLDAARQLNEVNSIDRVVLTGHGKIFAAGADAKEFDSDPVEPHLPEVIAAIEQHRLPWIAAINGAALGGGAEIALGCHYRIAAATAAIGFPEVTLGVVPGAGGTQRLPRLIGMQGALTLITQGKAVNAKQAVALQLVDAESDDPVLAATRLDLTVLKDRVALSLLPAVKEDKEALQAAQKHITKRMRLQDAPQRALELVASTSSVPFNEGSGNERQTFLQLRQSPQAKALRHVFFAERAAKAPADIAAIDTPELTDAIVVGGGNMGASIAYALSVAGVQTTIIETDADSCIRAKENIQGLINAASKRGLVSKDAAATIAQRLNVVEGYDSLPEAQLAIEAAFENMAVKKQVFTALAASLPPSAILATNTSYLDVNEIASTLEHPERLIGLHFFSPAHIMKLLEIVRGDASGDQALGMAYAVAKRLRKVPVISGVCDGFIGNRILARYREAADTLMMDGATPWEIDEAMVEFGYPMGPYEAQDLSGLDIAYANRQRQAADRDPQRRYIPIADRMVQEGRLGRKSGVGWYRYPGGGGKVIDPLLEDLITEEAHFAKVQRREFSADDIRDRLVLAMINEAIAILDEGIATRAADIDLVMTQGYGFPRWRGGLMFHADTLGVDNIRVKLKEYAAEDALVWQPVGLLQDLCDRGERLDSVVRTRG